MTGRGPGRRPGDPEQTRQTILDAAREVFGANGFDRATIRAIATAAEVDPALVMHHFGNKRALFVAAHQFPADPASVFAGVAELPVEQRGEALARLHLGLFARDGSPVLSLVRAAATDPAAAAMYRQFIEDTVLPSGLTILAQPERDGPLRMMLIASHLLGIAVARQIVGVGALTNPSVDDIVNAVAPTIQSYINGPPTAG